MVAHKTENLLNHFDSYDTKGVINKYPIYKPDIKPDIKYNAKTNKPNGADAGQLNLQVSPGTYRPRT